MKYFTASHVKIHTQMHVVISGGENGAVNSAADIMASFTQILLGGFMLECT